MSLHSTRREFIRQLAAIAAFAPLSRAITWRAPTPLRIGVIASGFDDYPSKSRQQGLELGLSEAQHAATLFGGAIEMLPITIDSVRKRTVNAVVGAEDEEHCRATADAASRAGLLYLNVACVAQTLRDEFCGHAVFHVVPSETMYRDAVALAPHAGSFSTAWEASLTRYGADTLNQRFRERFDEPMSEFSWFGWFAIKVLWESSLRARSVEPAALADYLRRESTQFDGHKGRPLSFRTWDNQLRQPMYDVYSATAGGAQTVTEVPPPATDTESARESLDRLGRRANHPCTPARTRP